MEALADADERLVFLRGKRQESKKEKRDSLVSQGEDEARRFHKTPANISGNHLDFSYDSVICVCVKEPF